MEELKKDYHKNFMQKHAEKIHETQTCSICCGKFQYFNKSRHNKTKKHLLYKQLSEITDEKDKKIFIYEHKLKAKI